MFEDEVVDALFCDVVRMAEYPYVRWVRNVKEGITAAVKQ